jgi:hypothetical protein
MRTYQGWQAGQWQPEQVAHQGQANAEPPWQFFPEIGFGSTESAEVLLFFLRRSSA